MKAIRALSMFACALLALAGCKETGSTAASNGADKPAMFPIAINQPARKVYLDIYVDYTILNNSGNVDASALHNDLIRDFNALFKAAMDNHEDLIVPVKPITWQSSQEIPVTAVPDFSSRFNQGVFISKFEDNDDKEVGASAASNMLVQDIENYGAGLRKKSVPSGTDFTPMLNDFLAIAQGRSGDGDGEHRIVIISDMIPQNQKCECLRTKSYGADIRAKCHLSKAASKVLLLKPPRTDNKEASKQARAALEAAIESIGYHFEEPALGVFADRCEHILDGSW